MAFGIDDALILATQGIKLVSTLTETLNAYRKGEDPGFDNLIEEVRLSALKQIREADLALRDLTRTLTEKGIDIDKSLQDVINDTPWWAPVESYRLKNIRRSFNEFSDATYSACDEIAALVRCKNKTREMGGAVVNSALGKKRLDGKLSSAKSFKDQISILREELSIRERALS